MTHQIHPLKRWLFEQQETALAFSARAGVSQSYLSEVLSGDKRPSLAAIDKITRATNGAITANDFQQMDTPKDAA